MNNTTKTGLNLDDSAIIGITTLITTYLISFFKIENNPIFYGMIQPLIKQLVQKFLEQDLGLYLTEILSYVTTYNVMIVLACFIIYKNYTKIYNYIMNKTNSYNMLVLNIYTEKDIKIFIEYLKHHRKFFDVPQSVDIGDIDIMYNSGRGSINSSVLLNNQKTSDNIYISFDDKNFNVKGRYKWTKNELKVDDEYTKKEKILKIPYLVIEIDIKSSIDVITYFEKITEIVEELTHDFMTQYYVKVYKDKSMVKNSTSIIYTGKKRSLETLEKLYIEPFFHKEKDIIWNLIKTIEYNPIEIYETGQIPRMGLLLYGDPGTGKSSFAFRIAMALKRHIVSLDLLDINNKNEIFEMMRNPKVSHSVLRPKDVVFIFDEFDRTVFSILNAGKYQKKKIIEEIQNNDDNDKEKDKEKDKKKENRPEITNEGTNLLIEDLQEVIQGAVPLENSIIIATTNRYDELKEKCPALFRVGRLTPVKFENADQWFINEVSKRFFNKELPYMNINKKNIQPSAIIEIALKCNNKIYENNYDLFIKRINEYIENI